MIWFQARWVGVTAALLVAGCLVVPGGSLEYGRTGAAGASPGKSSDLAGPTPTPTPVPARTATVPVIASLTASPTNLTQPGQEVVFHIEAVDAAGTPSYSWSATGGTLTATAGKRVGWRSPAVQGRYTILVLVTSQSGGATTGSVNIEVRGDGTAEVLPPETTPLPSASPGACAH